MASSDDPRDPLLSDLGRDPLLADLVAFFLDDLQRRVPQLQDAWDRKDLVALARHAHHLSGSAASYGYPQITSTAEAIEVGLAREADLAQVRERMEDLLLLCRRACNGAEGA